MLIIQDNKLTNVVYKNILDIVFRFPLSTKVCIIGGHLVNPWSVKSVLCPDLNEEKKGIMKFAFL